MIQNNVNPPSNRHQRDALIMALSERSLIKILASGHTWFDRIPRYRTGDEVISSAVHAHPGNTNLQEVFEKVVLVNSIYGTNIYNPFKMANHIVDHRIDARLERGDISLVEELRRGHGITVDNTHVEYDFYSFATKYLNWHRHDAFPIFDNLVKCLLPKLNRRFHFNNVHLSQGDLKHYQTLKIVIDSLAACTNLQPMRYKKIDKGLWLFAKYVYRGDQLRSEPDIVAEIERATNDA